MPASVVYPKLLSHRSRSRESRTHRVNVTLLDASLPLSAKYPSVESDPPRWAARLRAVLRACGTSQDGRVHCGLLQDR
eukprot:5560276-Pleurochrysis_carterae.AAC.2